MTTNIENTSLSSVDNESINTPKWLNTNFIQNILNEEIVITSLKIEDAVEVGESFMNAVYRAQAETEYGLISYIIKCVPENENRIKFLYENQLMVREIAMYDKTLPLLRGTDQILNYPHCFYIKKDISKEILVLKDLKPLGYRATPRQPGLDVAHCRLALTELAHLHGLSAALRIQKPEQFKTYIQDIYKDPFYNEENRVSSEQFLKPIFPSLSQAISLQLPFRFREISKIVDRMQNTTFNDLKSDVQEVYLPENQDQLENRVLVVNHGDYWSNNILFKYNKESDSPVACAMIDFQVARCASPSLDLQYFLYTSTTQATRRAYMNELLQLYLDEANKAMRSKGVTDSGRKFYKSVEEIKEDMYLHSNFGFMFGCIVLPVAIADKSAAPDGDEMADSISSNANPFAAMYSGPRFVKRISELLEDFDDMGYFKNRVKLGK